MRGVRPVPAALPDVPRHGRGGAVAAGPHRRHAGRPVARRRRRRRVRAVHGDVHPVPRVRAGVPERRPVRPPDGGHTRGARRRSPDGAAVAAGRASPCSDGTGCCSPARHCWRSRSDCGWSRSGPGWPGCRCGGGRGVAASVGPTRRRRVAVHGLRDGRLDARHPPVDGGRSSRRPARTFRGLARRLLRRAAQPRRARRRPPAGWPSARSRRCRATTPIVVNSAGCGAALKDYGHLLGTPAAAAFAARVVDVQEWLAGRLGSPAAGARAGSAR